MELSFSFRTELFSSEGEGAWVFVALPKDDAEDVREFAPGGPGFGSVRVRATIGSSVWKTSLFPSKPMESYVLPINKAVRARQKIDVGDSVDVLIDLILES